MARGNQREKAREKTQKAASSQKKKNSVRLPAHQNRSSADFSLQQSGTEFQRTKEAQADIMRAKQAAGTVPICWRTEGC
jgi:hypothetical protein